MAGFAVLVTTKLVTEKKLVQSRLRPKYKRIYGRDQHKVLACILLKIKSIQIGKPRLELNHTIL